MPKRGIPNIPRSSIGTERQTFDEVVKETLEVLTGQRVDKIAKLSGTATNAQIIDKINEIIGRLQ